MKTAMFIEEQLAFGLRPAKTGANVAKAYCKMRILGHQCCLGDQEIGCVHCYGRSRHFKATV